MNQDIMHLLEPKETVLWNGKPDLKSLLFLAILCSILIMSIAAILFFNIEPIATRKNTNLGANPKRVLSIISGVFFFIALLTPLIVYSFYKVTEYVVTNKRLIIKSGFIGADIRSVYYDQIRSAFVNVGLVGKLFSTGTILIDTGRITQRGKRGSKTVYDRFRFIKNPYQVYKFVQKGLSSRKEGMHSGRADFESNLEGYKDFVQETEKMKKDITN
jgi:hypothetical protein